MLVVKKLGRLNGGIDLWRSREGGVNKCGQKYVGFVNVVMQSILFDTIHGTWKFLI